MHPETAFASYLNGDAIHLHTLDITPTQVPQHLQISAVATTNIKKARSTRCVRLQGNREVSVVPSARMEVNGQT
jgi:hypothetical protein